MTDIAESAALHKAPLATVATRSAQAQHSAATLQNINYGPRMNSAAFAPNKTAYGGSYPASGK